MKIGLLIPSTSKQRNWKNYKQTYLISYTLKSFLTTYDQEHEYMFYIGIDRNDKIYDNNDIQEDILRFVNIMKNVSLKFVYMDNITPGHLTKMWNVLFRVAYDDQCDYFFQCGDDIEFCSKGWINDCINTLKSSDNIGLTGPMNNNARIFTQSFVSRKHMEIFDYYFPEELINWFCDDWINEVYRGINKFYPLKNHLCNNVGGKPRYDIHNIKNFQENIQNNWAQIRRLCNRIVSKDLQIIKNKVNIH